MNQMHRLWSLSVALCLLALPVNAGEQTLDEEEYQNVNVVYVERPLTLPAYTLRIDLAPPDRAFKDFNQGFSITEAEGLGTFDTVLGSSFIDQITTLRLGVGYGVVHGLEVGALLLPLSWLSVVNSSLGRLDADTEVGNPILYLRYQFLEGDIQLANQLDFNLPFDGADFSMRLGLPLKFQLGAMMHLTTGLAFRIAFDDEAEVSFIMPVEFAVNATELLFFGVHSGFSTGLSPDTFESLTVPLGFFAGYTFPLGSHLALDITAGFSWPVFLLAGSGDKTVYEDIYTVQMGATLYVDFFD